VARLAPYGTPGSPIDVQGSDCLRDGLPWLTGQARTLLDLDADGASKRGSKGSALRGGREACNLWPAGGAAHSRADTLPER